MAYNNAIPGANDLLSQSQSDILQNFAAIQTFIAVNHETFGDANEGKHKFVSLPEQVAAPTTAVNEIALYTKEVGIVAALFLRHEDDGTEVDITTAVKAVAGTCTLPSGIIIKWGSGVADSANPTVYPAAFPTTTLSVQLTSRVTGGATQHFTQVVDGTLAAAGLSTRSYTRGGHAQASSVYFLAIGY